MLFLGIRDFFGINRGLVRDSIRLKAIVQYIPNYQKFFFQRQFKFVACACFIVDIALCFKYDWSSLRFSRLLRPLYAVLWKPELRRWGMLISRTIPHVWELLVLLFVTLGVFAITGMLMFGRQGVENYFTDDLHGAYMDQHIAFVQFLPYRLPRLAEHLEQKDFP